MKSDTATNELVKISQAAEILGVSIDTLRRWEKSGKINPDYYTPGGTRLYSHQSLQEIKNGTFRKRQSLILSLRKTETTVVTSQNSLPALPIDLIKYSYQINPDYLNTGLKLLPVAKIIFYGILLSFAVLFLIIAITSNPLLDQDLAHSNSTQQLQVLGESTQPFLWDSFFAKILPTPKPH